MAEWVIALELGLDLPGSKPVCSQLIRFRTLAIPFTPLCKCCLSEESDTLKAVGPFYLVSRYQGK